jgi:hypothetical protein
MQAVIRRELLVLVAILPMWCMCTPVQADESPKAFVDRLIEAGNGILTSASDEDARLKCHRLLAWAFDVPAMAQYALGDACLALASRPHHDGHFSNPTTSD